MLTTKDIHVRLSGEAMEALSSYALSRRLTKANAAAEILNEAIYGRGRIPGNPPKQKFPDVDDGYVYVAKSARFYKIGRSKNPIERIKGITPPHGRKLVSVHKVANRHKAEKLLHEAFKEKRARGEWFKLNKDDLKRIPIFLQAREGL